MSMMSGCGTRRRRASERHCGVNRRVGDEDEGLSVEPARPGAARYFVTILSWAARIAPKADACRQQKAYSPHRFSFRKCARRRFEMAPRKACLKK
jgi:hypothetical protein